METKKEEGINKQINEHCKKERRKIMKGQKRGKM
jgi:hypothetical protein